MLYEETTSTLFCGDLFTQVGDGPALTTDDIVEAAGQAEDMFGATCLTPRTGPTIRTLAELAPATIAVMHGSCFSGDGAEALLALADDYDRRLGGRARRRVVVGDRVSIPAHRQPRARLPVCTSRRPRAAGGRSVRSSVTQGAVIDRRPGLEFECPMRGGPVVWAAKDVFNPAAIVRDGRVHLLIRGEDEKGTSRIGLAVSDNGFDFDVDPEPVLVPADDAWKAWRWSGGCEDPRVVEAPDGTYVCLYTAFDGKAANLFVATSTDLRHWEKQGPAFRDTAHARRWSKSGAVVTERRGNRLVASQLDGVYWMYWGEGACFAATSMDLLQWHPIEFDATSDRYLTFEPKPPHGLRIHRVPGQSVLRPLLFPRPRSFRLVARRTGPARSGDRRRDRADLQRGQPSRTRGDTTLPTFAYQPGQALFDREDPASCLGRTTSPMMSAEHPAEREGQVDNVCFAQGLVWFEERWILYYGMADSRIGCATASP